MRHRRPAEPVQTGPLAPARLPAIFEPLEHRRLFAVVLSVVEVVNAPGVDPTFKSFKVTNTGTDATGTLYVSDGAFNFFGPVASDAKITDSLAGGGATVTFLMKPKDTSFFQAGLYTQAVRVKDDPFTSNFLAATTISTVITRPAADLFPAADLGTLSSGGSFAATVRAGDLVQTDSEGNSLSAPLQEAVYFKLADTRTDLRYSFTTGSAATFKLYPDLNDDQKLSLSERTASKTEGSVTVVGGTGSVVNLKPGGWFFQFDAAGSVRDVGLAMEPTSVTPPIPVVRFGNTVISSGDTTPSSGDGTSFGTVDLGAGAAGAVRSFVLKNEGESPMELGALSVTGGFEEDASLPAVLAAGGSATFSVAILQTPGAKTGSVSFTTDAPGATTYSFSLAGTVVTPVLAATSGGTGLTGRSSDSIAFGTVLAGAAAPTRTITISNSGNSVLSLSNLSVPAGFSVVDGLAATIQPGGSDDLVIALSTSAAAVRSGVMSFTTNGTPSPFVFSVSGTVTAPVPTLAVTEGATPVASGAVLAFGQVLAGAAGPTRTLTFRNGGSAALTLAVTSVPDGVTLSTVPASLAPGATFDLVVTLSTAAARTLAGAVTLTTNDPNAATFTLTPTGTVVGPAPELLVGGQPAGGTVTFPAVTQGAAAPETTVTLRNAGGGALQLSAVTATDGFEVLDFAPASLTQGQSATVRVRPFTATAGSLQGMLTLTTSSGPLALPLAGTIDPAPTTGVSAGAVTAIFPASTVAGEKRKVDATFTLANPTDTARSGKATVAYYLSTDGTFDAGTDVLLASKSLTYKKLAAGASAKAVKQSLDLKSAPAGTYRLLAVLSGAEVDAFRAVAVSAATVTVSPATVSFAVAAPAAATLRSAKSVTLSLTLSNTGNSAAVGGLTYELFASSSAGAVSGDAVLLKSGTAKLNVKPGKSGKVTLSGKVSAAQFGQIQAFPAAFLVVRVAGASGTVASAVTAGDTLASVPATVG